MARERIFPPPIKTFGIILLVFGGLWLANNLPFIKNLVRERRLAS